MGKLWLKVFVVLILSCLGAAMATGPQEQALDQTREILEGLLLKEPQNVELLCLLAEAHFYYGDFLEGKEQIQNWEQGQAYAQKAVDLDPLSADAHYLVAAIMGRIGNAQGILKSLFLVTPMLSHLETVLALDPEYSWAYFILSHLYQELPPKPLGRGDRELALAYARTAWELEPTEPEFSLQYAKLLIKQQQQAQAKAVLTEALTSPFTKWTIPLRDEATGMLQSL